MNDQPELSKKDALLAKMSDEMKATVESCRAEGWDVEAVEISQKIYVYRPVTRSEWKALLKAKNEKLVVAGEDQVARAQILEDELENLISVCLIAPKIDITKIPAGAVSTLADAILLMSGFNGLDDEPVKL